MSPTAVCSTVVPSPAPANSLIPRWPTMAMSANRNSGSAISAPSAGTASARMLRPSPRDDSGADTWFLAVSFIPPDYRGGRATTSTPTLDANKFVIQTCLQIDLDSPPGTNPAPPRRTDTMNANQDTTPEPALDPRAALASMNQAAAATRASIEPNVAAIYFTWAAAYLAGYGLLARRGLRLAPPFLLRGAAHRRGQSCSPPSPTPRCRHPLRGPDPRGLQVRRHGLRDELDGRLPDRRLVLHRHSPGSGRRGPAGHRLADQRRGDPGGRHHVHGRVPPSSATARCSSWGPASPCSMPPA